MQHLEYNIFYTFWCKIWNATFLVQFDATF